MVRVRLISSDSIDFGLDDLQSDYLDDILKDFPDRDVAISVPFTSYTVLGFLKDVNCHYQNPNILELRNLLGLRNLKLEEEEDNLELEEEVDDFYDPHDDTNYEELEETQYLIKVELESNSSFSHLDQSDLESGDEVEMEEEEIANLQHQQSIQESLYEAPQDQTAMIPILAPLPRDSEEGEEERVQEANREEYADEQTIEPSNNFNETNIGFCNLNPPEAEVQFSDVSSLLEDDIQDTEMEQCVYTDLQDEILSDNPSNAAAESQPEVGPGLERNRKLQVIFVDLGLETIQDVKKAKGRKRKRGKKYF